MPSAAKRARLRGQLSSNVRPRTEKPLRAVKPSPNTQWPVARRCCVEQKHMPGLVQRKGVPSTKATSASTQGAASSESAARIHSNPPSGLGVLAVSSLSALRAVRTAHSQPVGRRYAAARAPGPSLLKSSRVSGVPHPSTQPQSSSKLQVQISTPRSSARPNPSLKRGPATAPALGRSRRRWHHAFRGQARPPSRSA